MPAPSSLPNLYPSAPHVSVRDDALRAAASLDRYLYSQPLHQPSTDAFARAAEWLHAADPHEARTLLIDSGCGTGRSTCMLAQANPNSLVLGVDRSEHRLGKQQLLPPNALLVRAELATFWRLMTAPDAGPLSSGRVARHTLFYPNPYPKDSQRRKRWHCHPSFPLLLGLGGSLEVRSCHSRAMTPAFASSHPQVGLALLSRCLSMTASPSSFAASGALELARLSRGVPVGSRGPG